jgi:hypothetical protein
MEAEGERRKEGRRTSSPVAHDSGWFKWSGGRAVAGREVEADVLGVEEAMLSEDVTVRGC